MIHTTIQAKARTPQAAFVAREFRAYCKREGVSVSLGLLRLMYRAIKPELERREGR